MWFCRACQEVSLESHCFQCQRPGLLLATVICGHPTLVISSAGRYEVRFCPSCRVYCLVERV